MRTMRRVLGIVTPIAAALGFILVAPAVVFGPNSSPRSSWPSESQPWLIASALLLEAVVGVVSGLLLRSQWALLVVPGGLVLGAIAGVFLSGNWYSVNDVFFVILIIFMIVAFGVASLPSVAAAALGVRLSRRFSKPAP